MFSLKQNRLRDIILLVLGMTGIIWFFFIYPSHHPLSTVDLKYSREEVQAKADSVLDSWQLQPGNLFTTVNTGSFHNTFDSLQRKWPKENPAEIRNRNPFLKQFPFYYWSIQKFMEQDYGRNSRVQLSISPEGEVIQYNLADSFINEQSPFNRLAVRKVFNGQEKISRSLEDSLIRGLIRYQNLGEDEVSITRSQNVIDTLRAISGREDGEIYTMSNIWELSDYYLNRSVWKHFDIRKDSVELLSESGIRFARTHYFTGDTLSGLQAKIYVEVLPAGVLKSLSVDIEPKTESKGYSFGMIHTIDLLLVLGFIIWLLIAFYLRIKARAVDTQPALIIAVVAGFIAPGILVLQFSENLGITEGIFNTAFIMNYLFMTAIMGALSAIGFFVLTVVSDSITRQYWPEKLNTWDLVRRGIVRNKPVGWVIFNALTIGGILIGIKSAAVTLIPDMYLGSEMDLITDLFLLPSMANLLMSTLISLLVILTIFLVISNQFVGLTGKKWIIPLISGLLFAFVETFRASMNPFLPEVLINFGIGVVVGLFYLRHDFLSIALGFFVYVNLTSTAQGWLIEASPDANTFYTFLILMAGLTLMAVSFIFNGSDEEELPEYIPDYLEDQAKEQRVKQELAIARTVQETFLPSKMHQLPGIDMAGICLPAQETGGDYYDMISLGKKRTALAIGDVSGKGIRAAFYMTFTKGVLHSLSAIVLSPVELLNQLNRLFVENATRGTFISMIYGILEADKRVFTFARAGHNPMLLVRNNGDTEWLKPKGIGVGVARGDQFIHCTEEASLKLKEGDVLILYTDGITEMMNGSGQFYGEERLERLVKGIRKAPSRKILDIIVEGVNKFKGMEKQHDDMTVIVIKADSSVNQ